MNFDHLVILDMKKAMVLDGRDVQTIASVVTACNGLIQSAREKKCTITYVMLPQKNWGTLINGLTPPIQGEVAIKDTDSAFSSREFRTRVAGYERLCIAGCFLENCIKATIDDALRENFQVELYLQAILALGRNPTIIDSIVKRWTHTKGITLLDIHT